MGGCWEREVGKVGGCWEWEVGCFFFCMTSEGRLAWTRVVMEWSEADGLWVCLEPTNTGLFSSFTLQPSLNLYSGNPSHLGNS